MDNLETLATSATQDTERMQKKKNEQHAPQQIIHVLIYCGKKSSILNSR